MRVPAMVPVGSVEGRALLLSRELGGALEDALALPLSQPLREGEREAAGGALL